MGYYFEEFWVGAIIWLNYFDWISSFPSLFCSILIQIYTKDGGDVGLEFHKYIWALCGDDNLNGCNQQKVDPCLKLFTGCPLMINTNTEKSNKIFKGTLGSFVGLRWKEGCGPHIENYHDYKVFAATVAAVAKAVGRVILPPYAPPSLFTCMLMLNTLQH